MGERPELNRDAYLLETLARLQCCVRALGSTADVAYPKVSEMPEFENFTMRIAGFEGWGGGMRRIWEGYMADYKGVAVERSPLVNAVVAWTGSPQGTKAVREGLWVRASEIYKVLEVAFGYNNKMALAALARNKEWFGRRMLDNMSGLRYALNTETMSDGKQHLYRFKPDEQGVEAAKEAWEALPGRWQVEMNRRMEEIDEI